MSAAVASPVLMRKLAITVQFLCLFGFFLVGNGIVQQRRTGTHFCDAVLDAHSAERQAGIHVAIETDHADRSTIPCARALFMGFYEAHRP